VAEEKEAVAQFGSSDSGASLGDILGAALKKRKAGGKDDDKEDDKDDEE
jgi:small subunit ribosomal protein S1